MRGLRIALSISFLFLLLNMPIVSFFNPATFLCLECNNGQTSEKIAQERPSLRLAKRDRCVSRMGPSLPALLFSHPTKKRSSITSSETAERCARKKRWSRFARIIFFKRLSLPPQLKMVCRMHEFIHAAERLRLWWPIPSDSASGIITTHALPSLWKYWGIFHAFRFAHVIKMSE